MMNVLQHNKKFYIRKGGEVVHDQRAHARLDKQDELIREHTKLLQNMDNTLAKTCTTLTNISDQLKPVTRTIMVAGWMQKLIVWVSPIALFAIALWKVLDEYSHNHLGL